MMKTTQDSNVSLTSLSAPWWVDHLTPAEKRFMYEEIRTEWFIRTQGREPEFKRPGRPA